MDLLAGITCVLLSRKVHCGLKIPIWFGRELLNNSCVLYCAAVSEKYEDQSQRNPYGSVSAGREKWPFNVLFFLKVEPQCDQT